MIFTPIIYHLTYIVDAQITHMLKMLNTFSFNVSFKVISANDLQNIFSGDGKIIFIRHAYAPGGGDPDGFDISNCASQRNLNSEGIAQSKRIGKFFEENDIIIDKVLSSEWCRCKETAKYAFNNYETKSFLNSFFSQKFAHNKDKQMKELKGYIINWDGKKKLNISNTLCCNLRDFECVYFFR